MVRIRKYALINCCSGNLGHGKEDIMCDHWSEGKNCDIPAICSGHAGGCYSSSVNRNCGLLDGHPAGRVSQCKCKMWTLHPTEF